MEKNIIHSNKKGTFLYIQGFLMPQKFSLGSMDHSGAFKGESNGGGQMVFR